MSIEVRPASMNLSLAARAQMAVILVSFGFAWLWPVPTLLWSYAILGPLHYTSEISWLHQRHYGAASGPSTWSWVPLVAGLAGLTAAFCFQPLLGPLTVLLGLGLGAAAAIASSIGARARILGAVVVLGILLARWAPATWVVLGIFVPTLIHVSVFTLMFMVNGAIRGKDRSFILVVLGYALLLGLAASSTGSIQVGVSPVWSLADRMGAWFTGKAIYRSLAFVYLAHYLNWFTKTSLLGWHRNRLHLGVVVVAWAVSVGLYLWDYGIGLRVQLFLSVLHVFLEFPLNARVVRELSFAAAAALRHRRGPGRPVEEGLGA